MAIRDNRPIFTYEQFKPAYPQTGNFVRLFRGTFEDNRESLSPCMVYARDFYATDDAHALQLGALCAQTVAAEFIGFEGADQSGCCTACGDHVGAKYLVYDTGELEALCPACAEVN